MENNKIDTEELTKSVAHLVEASAEELKEEIDEATETTENDEKYKERYTFQFKWKDGRGKVWKGSFTNKILTIAEQQAVGILRAKLGGGMPSNTIDAFTNEINLMIAHMTYSLDDVPEWAKDLRKLQSVELLQQIYLEVASHEATFFGSSSIEENS